MGVSRYETFLLANISFWMWYIVEMNDKDVDSRQENI